MAYDVSKNVAQHALIWLPLKRLPTPDGSPGPLAAALMEQDADAFFKQVGPGSQGLAQL